MKLYVVMEVDDENADIPNTEIMGIYSTYEKAEELRSMLKKKELKEAEENGFEPFAYNIEEYELDKYKFQK